MKYSKVPLTFEKQVELLASRGLVIPDKKRAQEFLSRVNYYRLSAYCLPFAKSPHKFIDGTTFDDVAHLYEFDYQLRLVLDLALEHIEVYTRTNLAYILAHKYGPFAHEDQANFFYNFKHTEFIDILRRETEYSREVFVGHHKSTYDEFPQLPIWVAVEIMSFGCVSTLIENGLKKEDIIALSSLFGLHSKVFCSWLHTLSYIRNICAHHSRLWNRTLSLPVVLPKHDHWKGFNQQKMGTLVMAINTMLLRSCEPAHYRTWRESFERLIEGKPNVPHFHFSTGLPENWKDHPLWKKP